MSVGTSEVFLWVLVLAFGLSCHFVNDCFAFVICIVCDHLSALLDALWCALPTTLVLGPLHICVSVSGQGLLNEMTFDLDIWHAGSSITHSGSGS